MMREGRLIEGHGLQYQTLWQLVPPACVLSPQKKKGQCAGVWSVAAVVEVSVSHGPKKSSPEVVSVRLCIGYCRFLPDGCGREFKVPRVLFFFFSRLYCAIAFPGGRAESLALNSSMRRWYARNS